MPSPMLKTQFSSNAKILFFFLILFQYFHWSVKYPESPMVKLLVPLSTLLAANKTHDKCDLFGYVWNTYFEQNMEHVF